MHSSHSERGTGVCLTAGRQSKTRFPARDLTLAPRLTTQTAAVSLPQFQRSYSAKGYRGGSAQSGMQWGPLPAQSFSIPEQGSSYNRGETWQFASGDEELHDSAHHSSRRHIGEYNVTRTEYPVENESHASVHRHYQGNVAVCSPSGHPNPTGEDSYSSYSEDDRGSQDTEAKAAKKFAWMKNTKSHHIEWKTQWERGGQLVCFFCFCCKICFCKVLALVYFVNAFVFQIWCFFISRKTFLGFESNEFADSKIS